MSLYKSSLGALGGSPSLGALAAKQGARDLRAAYLATQPTYAWLGDDLPKSGAIATWTDAVAGIVATGAGTIPQVGEIGGRRAAAFDGARWFNLGAVPAMQELNRAIVAVMDVPSDLSTQPIMSGNTTGYPGITNNRRGLYRWRDATNTDRLFVTPAGFYIRTAAWLWQMDVAGSNATVTMRANAMLFNATRTDGHNPITATAWAMGAYNQAGQIPFIGSIADLLVFTGTDYATRAAAAFNVARWGYALHL